MTRNRSSGGRPPPDPAAAQYPLAIVKDSGLAGRDRAGWTLQNQCGLFRDAAGIEYRWHRRLRRAELGGYRHIRARRRAEPIYLAKQ